MKHVDKYESDLKVHISSLRYERMRRYEEKREGKLIPPDSILLGPLLGGNYKMPKSKFAVWGTGVLFRG